jgi:hypothetical protein
MYGNGVNAPNRTETAVIDSGGPDQSPVSGRSHPGIISRAGYGVNKGIHRQVVITQTKWHKLYRRQSGTLVAFAPGGAPGLFWMLDLAPDGRQIVALFAQTAAAGPKPSVHVTVLLTFFEELKRRMH